MGNAEAKARKLLRRAGTLRARELVNAGIARAQLTRLVEAGALIRLSRGVYALAERNSDDTDDGLRVIAERLPHPRLCLLSALRLHGLTTQAPFERWVSIGNSDRAPRIDWPPLRVVRMSATTLNAGLEAGNGCSIARAAEARTFSSCWTGSPLSACSTVSPLPDTAISSC
ncbi:hypothetical protein SGMN_05890 [Stenotrophomonas geniculata]